MILLNGDTLEALLGEAIGSAQCQITAGYFDNSASANAPGRSLTVTSGVTPVTAVGTPSTGYNRQIFEFSLRNTDSITHSVGVRYNNGSTTYNVVAASLAVNESLQYSAHRGWYTLDAAGNTRTIATGLSLANWTPTDESGAALSLTVNYAQYALLGGMCFIVYNITYPTTASGATQSIGGLPVIPSQSIAVVSSVVNMGAPVPIENFVVTSPSPGRLTLYNASTQARLLNSDLSGASFSGCGFFPY